VAEGDVAGFIVFSFIMVIAAAAVVLAVIEIVVAAPKLVLAVRPEFGALVAFVLIGAVV
jgi:hypothetical protein